MSETGSLKVQARDKTGSREAERVRKQGMIPAVIYGHKEAEKLVSIPREEFELAFRKHQRAFNLDHAGQTESVRIQDLQYDHMGSEILHVDFRRVTAGEKIKVTVDVQLKGTSPGTLKSGVLDFALHSLPIECASDAVPDAIVVNIGELQIDQAIHVNELKLPAGVEVLLPPNTVVVQVKVPQVDETLTTPTEGATPEVITAKKKDDDDSPAKK